MSDLNPNQIRGYKATVHNANVSEEAQEHAREVLREAGEPETTRRGGRTADNASNTGDLESSGNPGNVLGGHKATLKNPNISDEAKSRSEQILREHDAI